MTVNVPNPGSREAIAAGCKCPPMDNSHGRGYMGVPSHFVIVEGCPLHDPKREEATDGQPES